MSQGVRVLIVDDEEPIRKLLTRWFNEWGYGVRSVESALEALEVMAVDSPDILVTDLSMPEHDGLWLAERVNAQWPDVKIIVSTVFDDSQTVRVSRELGAFAYVTKPFEPYLVRQALDNASGRLRFRNSVDGAAEW